MGEHKELQKLLNKQIGTSKTVFNKNEFLEELSMLLMSECVVATDLFNFNMDKYHIDNYKTGDTLDVVMTILVKICENSYALNSLYIHTYNTGEDKAFCLDILDTKLSIEDIVEYLECKQNHRINEKIHNNIVSELKATRSPIFIRRTHQIDFGILDRLGTYDEWIKEFILQ